MASTIELRKVQDAEDSRCRVIPGRKLVVRGRIEFLYSLGCSFRPLLQLVADCRVITVHKETKSRTIPASDFVPPAAVLPALNFKFVP